MILEQIFFEGFRNLKKAEIRPCPSINVVCGDNAQGKTNLLEAIWLFTGGRSFRGSKDRELVTFGQQKARLEMFAETFGRVQNLNIEINNGKRAVTINKVSQQTASSLIGKFCAVVFSPVHLSLVKDGPSIRRRFLDTAICQLQPHYTAQFIKYNHILNQRNTLIRQLEKGKNLEDTLDIWDETLAECGADLIFRRFSYLEKLKILAAKFYEGLSSGKESLSISYKTTTINEKIKEKNQIKELFGLKLKKTRQEDILVGFTTKGPHRDDLEIKINGKSARLFSSQGQQRSAVLAMKLAESELVGEIINEKPVILLDDVLSELDFGRQNYLLNSILEKQVFITCCEPELTKKMSIGKILKVSQGEFI